MSFFEAIAACLSKYGDFKGRASRAELWWFLLFLFLASVLLNQLTLSFFGITTATVFSTVFTLAMIVPTISVGARRLHDMNHTGWWLLLALLLIGVVVLLIWSMLPGTNGVNRFGNPPPTFEN